MIIFNTIAAITFLALLIYFKNNRKKNLDKLKEENARLLENWEALFGENGLLKNKLTQNIEENIAYSSPKKYERRDAMNDLNDFPPADFNANVRIVVLDNPNVNIYEQKRIGGLSIAHEPSEALNRMGLRQTSNKRLVSNKWTRYETHGSYGQFATKFGVGGTTHQKDTPEYQA